MGQKIKILFILCGLMFMAMGFQNCSSDQGFSKTEMPIDSLSQEGTPPVNLDDKTAPIVNFITPLPSSLFSESVQSITFSVTDSNMPPEGEGIKCQFNNENISCVPDLANPLGQQTIGNHIFTVTATDKFGNTSVTSHQWSVEDKPCVNEKRLGIWLDPDKTGEIKSENYLGSIYSFSGDKTVSQNYNYYSASAHPVEGPTPVGYELNIFFYDGTDGLGLNAFANIDSDDQSQGSSDNTVSFDVITTGNNGGDSVLISDDNGELKLKSSSTDENNYEGRFRYWYNTDGGAIGPFVGEDYKIRMEILSTGDIQDARFFSSDGNSFTLKHDDNISSFIIAFKDYQVCN